MADRSPVFLKDFDLLFGIVVRKGVCARRQNLSKWLMPMSHIAKTLALTLETSLALFTTGILTM
jgi:hypothetical protein